MVNKSAMLVKRKYKLKSVKTKHGSIQSYILDRVIKKEPVKRISEASK